MNYQYICLNRPAASFDKIITFYQQGLGFNLLSKKKNEVVLHNGGLCKNFYLRFYLSQDAADQVQSPSEDYLIVFYISEQAEWESYINRMLEAGFQPVTALNPYWDQKGKTFVDVTGHRIVFQKANFGNHKVRLAKPAADLDTTSGFYIHNFGFSLIGSFRDHDGFDGDIVGNESDLFHFEFTRPVSAADQNIQYQGHLCQLFNMQQGSEQMKKRHIVDPDGYCLELCDRRDFEKCL